MAVAPIPPGYSSVTPYLIVRDARKAIDFYQRAFGAVDLLAAVVSKWSGSRKHLAQARPEFSALLARIENEPRVAPIFARHWPPAAGF